MKNSIGLYFNLEICDRLQALSLVSQSLKEIERLENAGVSIGYWQLRANELANSLKEIWIKIDSNQGTYIESISSNKWTAAFNKVIGVVEGRIFHEEADRIKQVALLEMTLPVVKDSVWVDGRVNNDMFI
jgi:hypothetical protein